MPPLTYPLTACGSSTSTFAQGAREQRHSIAPSIIPAINRKAILLFGFSPKRAKLFEMGQYSSNQERIRRMKLSERYAHLLENFDKLPDDAVIPTAVTAALLSVNPKTIVSHFESVQISPGRTGQRVGYLRAKLNGKKVA
jgi:hypothetical protein